MFHSEFFLAPGKGESTAFFEGGDRCFIFLDQFKQRSPAFFR